MDAAMSAARVMPFTLRTRARDACGIDRDVLFIANDRIALKKSNTSDDRHAEFSCASISLRVKSGHRVRRSMCWSNKQPSTSELNSDSISSSLLVNDKRRSCYETIRSCGVAPALKKAAPLSPSKPKTPHRPDQNAGLRAGVFSVRLPGFSFARDSHAQPHRLIRARFARAPVPTEFISVSGFRTDRSALRSDLRLKRISGPVAATGHPYAPMNSPLPHLHHEQRVSFSTFRLTS
jgi:hypothetical protein